LAKKGGSGFFSKSERKQNSEKTEVNETVSIKTFIKFLVANFCHAFTAPSYNLFFSGPV
jgi:hypothetical protein